MKRIAWLLSLVSLVRSPVLAIGPPINTDTPITLGLEGRGIRSFVKVVRASSDPLDGRVTTTLWPLAIPYNVTTEGVVGIIVPRLFKEVRRGSETVSSSGLGDISIFAKYVVLQIDRHQETFRLAPKIVLKLPTGDEKETPALGSGATDISFGGVAAWLRGRLGVYADGLYQATGKANERQVGNGVAYNFALAYRLLPVVYRTYPAQQVNAYLEFNGSWKGKDQTEGQTVSDSGGQVLFFSPGFQYIPLSRLLIETSFQLPVLKNLNGVQMESDWTINVGLRALLY